MTESVRSRFMLFSMFELYLDLEMSKSSNSLVWYHIPSCVGKRDLFLQTNLRRHMPHIGARIILIPTKGDLSKSSHCRDTSLAAVVMMIFNCQAATLIAKPHLSSCSLHSRFDSVCKKLCFGRFGKTYWFGRFLGLCFFSLLSSWTACPVYIILLWFNGCPLKLSSSSSIIIDRSPLYERPCIRFKNRSYILSSKWQQNRKRFEPRSNFKWNPQKQISRAK